VAATLHYSGVLTVCRWWRNSRARQVYVLGLHRVLTPEEAARTCSEPGVVMLLPTFRRLLQTLQRDFEIISLREFTASHWGKSGRAACLLTFDDAWRDTFGNALPVLRDGGFPAVVFAPSGLIGSDQSFWVERLTQLWREFGGDSKPLPRMLGAMLGQIAIPNLDAAIAALKQVPATRRESIVQALCDQCHCGSPEALDHFMSREQLRSAAPTLQVESHTVTHPLLTFEDQVTIERELRLSKQTLERDTGAEVTAFAYPSGAWDERVRSAVEKAGYHWAFTTRAAPYRADCDPLTVPRFLLHEGNVTGPHGQFSPAMLHFQLMGWR
jgi:peptidoglycan/xylan/chitin deacetylase (PgdA/CDA1 family)